MLCSARPCFCLLLPLTLFCLWCRVAQVVPFLCFLMGMRAGVAAFLTVSGHCSNIHELSDPACLCVSLLPWIPSLWRTCCHVWKAFISFAQNLDTQNPTQNQFFSISSSPSCVFQSPLGSWLASQLLIAFLLGLTYARGWKAETPDSDCVCFPPASLQAW